MKLGHDTIERVIGDVYKDQRYYYVGEPPRYHVRFKQTDSLKGVLFTHLLQHRGETVQTDEFLGIAKTHMGEEYEARYVRQCTRMGLRNLQKDLEHSTSHTLRITQTTKRENLYSLITQEEERKQRA